MIGARLGEWQVERELGRGAVGVVYLAERIDDPNRQAAVKCLEDQRAADPVFRFRFQAEVEALQQLDHPNIVRFLGSGLHDGTPYLIMEYVDGPDLESVLYERGPLAWSEVLDLGKQMAAGLKHAHQRGILHLDLKPANVILTADGDAKITDFGIAMMLGRDTPSEPGTVVGGLAYLAPERITGKPTTKRSDVYAFGGLLYTMATNRPPFLGNNAVEILHKHCYTQPERPARLAVNLPHDLDELIFAMLEKDPARRPGDGGVVLKELDRIIGKLSRQGKLELGSGSVHDLSLAGDLSAETPAFVPPVMAPSPRPLMSRPEVVIPLFVLLIAATAFGVYYTESRPDADELFARAEPLLDSDDPADWERAWDESFSELEKHHPGKYPDEVGKLRRQVEGLRALRKALVSERVPGKPVENEAERFFRNGLGLAQVGDLVGARAVWMAVIVAFEGVAEAAPWVRLATLGLERTGGVPESAPATLSNPIPRDDPALQGAIARIRDLRGEGESERADAIANALNELYRNQARRDQLADLMK